MKKKKVRAVIHKTRVTFFFLTSSLEERNTKWYCPDETVLYMPSAQARASVQSDRQ